MTRPEDLFTACPLPARAYSMSSDLYILNDNAILIPPTKDKPYYQVSVTTECPHVAGCTITISATKEFPDPLKAFVGELKSDNPKVNPADWVSITHFDENCCCARFSRDIDKFFAVWQAIHNVLRHRSEDQASYAFYPKFEYEDGEALAHASLVACLALGVTIPDCYNTLVPNFGGRELKLELISRMEVYTGEQLDIDLEDDIAIDNALWELGFR
ncbi:hypothetical protein GQX73_g10474 [Xylaria multiplex]|uniref:Uncharacterized protein n=1 Tax=Xylaria multiplex TaxID=323545 RepID=A0A7C8MI77_9PEZI|nr:hypothetical protein GQX73_g10474 [Xylaria multiplex]